MLIGQEHDAVVRDTMVRGFLLSVAGKPTGMAVSSYMLSMAH
jgi:hypothetical protein